MIAKCINIFNIIYKQYIQLSERLKCNKKIPPNEFNHTGKHTHEENGFHYCAAKCQFCEYFVCINQKIYLY